MKTAQLYDAEVEAVFFDTPIEICMERNAARHRIVPEEAIREMARKLRPPAFDEGFNRITLFEPARPRDSAKLSKLPESEVHRG